MLLLTTGSESQRNINFYNPLIPKVHINDKARCASTTPGIGKRSKDQNLSERRSHQNRNAIPIPDASILLKSVVSDLPDS